MYFRRLALVVLACAAGCGGARAPAGIGGLPNDSSAHTPAGTQRAPLQTREAPDIGQNGQLWLSLGSKIMGGGIGLGPDGVPWIADDSQGCLYRLALQPTSLTKKYCMQYTVHGATSTYYPGSFAIGGDGRFYFDNLTPPPGNAYLGAGTTTGSFVVYAIPSGDVPTQGIANAPDGNVWFVEAAHVGKISTSGVVTEYTYPSGETNNADSGLVVGPDNDLWFTERSIARVAKVNLANGVIYEYPLNACSPAGIATEPGSTSVFVGCSGSPGSVREVPVGNPFSQITHSIGALPLNADSDAVTADGSKFVAFASGAAIGRLNTTTDIVLLEKSPYAIHGGLTAAYEGPDQNLYGLGAQHGVFVRVLDRIFVEPNAVTFPTTGSSVTVSASYVGNGSGTFTATSLNPSIATVAATSSKTQWTVTAVGAGHTTIRFSDGLGNYSDLQVTVQ